MKSRFSKLSTGVALIAACGSLTSCALFGGGKYADQTEVETEVPDSLEQGKPSTGPAAGSGNSYASNPGVPAASNLAEVPDPWQPPPSQPPPLPGISQTGGSQPGGASLTGMPAEGGRALIDIPKPDFNHVSVHSNRPPAEMLSLGSSVNPATTRMSLNGGPRSASPSSAVIKETVQPLPDTASESELANVSKAVKSDSVEPGVPLLHSGSRLSDFYQGIHQELLNNSVVENQIPVTEGVETSSEVTLSVPPPPPAEPTSAPQTE